MAKTAIIIGGGSGLGQATAIRMAQEGINIAVVDISEKGGERNGRTGKSARGGSDFY